MTPATLWAAFGLGVLVGFVAAGVVRAWRDDKGSGGYPVDVTRPRLSFYQGDRAGVEVWRRSTTR